MGHEVMHRGASGDAHTIWVAADGTAYGVSDKRSPTPRPRSRALTAPAAGR